MENVMSVEEKGKIIQFYSARLDRSSGSLGRYYAEIVDNKSDKIGLMGIVWMKISNFAA